VSSTDDRPSSDASRFERLVRSRWYGAGGIQGLSKLSGVSRATMYAWFRGEAVPDTKSLARLASVLDVSAAELLETLGGGAPSAPPSIAPPMPSAVNQPSLATPAFTALPPTFRGGGPPSEPAVAEALLRQEVMWCGIDDPIGPVARTLYERHFSQMPVRDGDEWIGLLTTEAIARWMAGRSRHGLDVEAKAPVREVLAYADDAGDFRVVPPDVSVGDIVGLFDGAALRGLPLRAVLVAGSRRDASARGIVTTYDLPHLRRISAGDRSRQR
jgi:predicted transcriptional regulator